MTLKPAAVKLVLRTSAINCVERPHFSLTGTLPEEVREAFQHKKEPASERASLDSSGTACLSLHSHRDPVRPNFFIPILAVGSYVVPFFMTMFLALHIGRFPGVRWVSQLVASVSHNTVIHTGMEFEMLFLSSLLAPMLAGALCAYILSKISCMNIKLKLTIWFVLLMLFCIAEYFASPLFASK